MAIKKQESNSDETESFKIRKVVLDKVRDNKKDHGSPIQFFIEQAIEEKLLNDEKKRKLLRKIKN